MDFRSTLISILASIVALMLSYLDAKFFDKKRTNITYIKQMTMVGLLVYTAIEIVPFDFLRDTGIQIIKGLDEPIMIGKM